MPGCAAIGCNNRSEKGYTMKCFPRDRKLRAIWQERVGRADWEPSNNSFLCHVHFEPQEWMVTTNGKLKLKKDALPSIFTITSTRKSAKKRTMNRRGDGNLRPKYLNVEYLENDTGGVPILEILDSPDEEETPEGRRKVRLVGTRYGATYERKKNLVVVSDRNTKEIGRFVDNDDFVIVADYNDKEIGQFIASEPPAMVKLDNHSLDAQEQEEAYDELEERLREICDGPLVEKSPRTGPNKQSPGINDTATLRLLLESRKDAIRSSEVSKNCSTNHKRKPGRPRKVPVVRPKEEEPDSRKAQFTIKLSGVEEDVTEIMSELNQEGRNKVEMVNRDTRFVTSIITVEDDIQVESSRGRPRVKVEKSTSEISTPGRVDLNSTLERIDGNLSPGRIYGDSTSGRIDSSYPSKDPSYEDLEKKVYLQQQSIDKLTDQLSMYDEVNGELASTRKELEEKTKELGETLNKRRSMGNQKALKKLAGRASYLEGVNKKLLKSIDSESQQRKSLEVQLKKRDSQIKELRWKLEKAAKFLERAERNANSYRKKMLGMQTALRRQKNYVAAKREAERRLEDFTEEILDAAMEVKRKCGSKTYEKLLGCNISLPSLRYLRKRFPNEEFLEEEWIEEFILDALGSEDRNRMKSNGSSYDTGVVQEPETVVRTVQDLFEEGNDGEIDIQEIKRHFMSQSGSGK